MGGRVTCPQALQQAVGGHDTNSLTHATLCAILRMRPVLRTQMDDTVEV
jgi:hypothetical protein